MAAPRKYTDEQLNEAMELYKHVGAAEASRQTGIPKGTIASLAHRNGNATIAMANTQEATAALAAKRALTLETIKLNWAELTLDMQAKAMDAEAAKDAYSYTLSGAISTDKLLLMSGEATSRHETRGDLDRFIRTRLEQIEQGKRGLSDGRIIDPDAIEAEAHTG